MLYSIASFSITNQRHHRLSMTMTYRYILTVSILSNGLIASSTHSLAAQEILALSSHCQKVIGRSVVRLQAIPNVKVTTNSRFAPLTVPYPDVEAILDRRYVFVMEGSGVQNVWKSPNLMIGITQKIIDGCAGMAMVTFGRAGSGEYVDVGLFPNRKVKIFTCSADFFDSRTRTRPSLTWGQQICDL